MRLNHPSQWLSGCWEIIVYNYYTFCMIINCTAGSKASIIICGLINIYIKTLFYIMRVGSPVPLCVKSFSPLPCYINTNCVLLPSHSETRPIRITIILIIIRYNSGKGLEDILITPKEKKPLYNNAVALDEKKIK